MVDSKDRCCYSLILFDYLGHLAHTMKHSVHDEGSPSGDYLDAAIRCVDSAEGFMQMRDFLDSNEDKLLFLICAMKKCREARIYLNNIVP